MIHSRGADGSDAELVWTQVLQGMGGGFAAICSGIGAQASVPHADVAMITALVLLWTEIGAGVGGSIAGAIWSGAMPGALKEHLPGLTQEERDVLFGSITDVRARPLGDPVRQGVIAGSSSSSEVAGGLLLISSSIAYSDTMKTMLIVATVLSVVPVGLALLMPDWYLGDQQNAVYDADAGRRSARTSVYVGEEGVDEVVSDEDEEDVEEEDAER